MIPLRTAAEADATPQGDNVVFVSRGIERDIVSPPTKGLKMPPNTVNVHRLRFPSGDKAEFEVDTVRTVTHDKYKANDWPVCMGVSSRYIAAPTAIGEVYIWNLAGQLVAVLHDHASKRSYMNDTELMCLQREPLCAKHYFTRPSRCC